MEQNGAGIWIKNPDDAYSILSDLLNKDEKLNEMKQNIKRIAKPNSTKDICTILFK